MVGGRPPWTRDLRSPPPLHDSGAGGGLSGAGHWRPSGADGRVHVKPRAVICQATCRDHRNNTALCAHGEEPVWQQDWGVPGPPVGRGEHAFRSLAPSIVRVAIRQKRLLTLADGPVTGQDQASATAQPPCCPRTAEALMRRLLPHVLPDRGIHVRSDGWRSPATRHGRNRTRPWLAARALATQTTGQQPGVQQPMDAPRCPHCGSILIVVQTLRPNTRSPP